MATPGWDATKLRLEFPILVILYILRMQYAYTPGNIITTSCTTEACKIWGLSIDIKWGFDFTVAIKWSCKLLHPNDATRLWQVYCSEPKEAQCQVWHCLGKEISRKLQAATPEVQAICLFWTCMFLNRTALVQIMWLTTELFFSVHFNPLL